MQTDGKESIVPLKWQILFIDKERIQCLTKRFNAIDFEREFLIFFQVFFNIHI